MSDNGMLLKRRASKMSFLSAYVVLALIAAGCVAVSVVLLAGVLQLVVAGVGILILLCGIGIIHLSRMCTEYRLYPDRLEVESGIIAKRIENVKLFRVRDIGLSQGVMGRVFGFGDISLASTDASSPHTRVRGVDNPREIYDRISAIVSQTSAQRRTMIVEDMHTGEGEMQ